MSPELPHGRNRVVERLEPESGQHEGGGPALGALDEDLDLLDTDLQPALVHEELASFGRRQCELVRTDLVQRAPRARRCEPQRRIGARRSDHAHVRRQVLERVVDRRQALLVRHRVHLVEHDHQAAPECSHPVEKLVDYALERTARNVESSKGSSTQALPHAVHGRRRVSPEPSGIVVVGIEGDPGDGVVVTGAPHAHSRRLTVPGGAATSVSAASLPASNACRMRVVDQRRRKLGAASLASTSGASMGVVSGTRPAFRRPLLVPSAP